MHDAAVGRSEPPERAERRHLRVRCTLQAGEATLIGTSNNVSTSGLSVRLNREQVTDGLVVGSRVGISFALPGQTEALRSPADVVWVDPDDHQPTGEAAIGVGLRFLDPSSQLTEAL